MALPTKPTSPSGILTWLLPAMVVAAVACADSKLSSTGPESVSGDGVASDAGPDGTGDGPDTDRVDVGFDVDTEEADGAVDTRPGGVFLDPCEEDADCVSNYCIQYEESRVCTERCSATSCAEGWVCRLLDNSGADAIRICVPAPDDLCRLCESNIECGGLADACVSVDNHWVCARDCEETGVCPEGYVCATATDRSETLSRQCVPETGVCSCSPSEDGESRPCVQVNEWGICEGVEVCNGAEGWSRCSAPFPSEEICDGLDNDCDGLRDERMDPRPCTSTPNPLGTCEGTERCEGEDGWVCDAKPASIEVCDGLDNDCNGIADDGLCFDGNPCTLDVCDPDGDDCTFVPRMGDCDDLDVCTRNDICRDGVCVGSPISCDDGNQCTVDTCDPATGCHWTNADGTPCETGNLCTNDTCQGGVCAPGPPVSCGSDDECRVASCDPATGCTTEPLTGNRCNDGDDCTVDNRCSNGFCDEGRPFCEGHSCEDCSRTWGAIGDICVENFLGLGPACFCLCF
jgi:hypothetical protein